MKTYDKTLITLHLTFMTCIVAFTFFSIVVFRSYKKFETPDAQVEYRVVQSAFDARAGSTTGLAYCSGTGNDFVDYVSPAGVTYADPTCVTGMHPSEFTEQNAKHAWFFTHFRQSTYKRSCPNATAGAFATCNETKTNTVDGFVANVETLAIEFSTHIKTTWGMRQEPHELEIRYPSGAKTTTYGGSRTTLSIAQLLELAGTDLEARSTSALGTAAVYNAMRAPHRLIGLHLTVVISATNVHPLEPFDDSLKATLSVESVPLIYRKSPATQLTYLGGGATGTPQELDATRVERDWAGIFIEFQGSGRVGITDPFQMIVAITNAFVLIGMATFAVDFVGEFFVSGFNDDKYEDDHEREILEGFDEHMQKHTVPFDPKDLRLVNDFDEPGMCYEDAIFELMTQMREVEDRLSMIPEEEAEFVEGSAPGRQPEGSPILRLVEEFSEEQIIAVTEATGKAPVPAELELHPGAQMMGRGVCNVLSKAVSRQQFTLTVVKDKVRMKALRDGPGYMRSDSLRYEQLKMNKAVVLGIGDRVVFRMREGKIGGHLGIYRIAADSEKPKSFFSILLGC